VVAVGEDLALEVDSMKRSPGSKEPRTSTPLLSSYYIDCAAYLSSLKPSSLSWRVEVVQALGDLGSGPDVGAAGTGGGAGPEDGAELVVLEAGGRDVGRAVGKGVDDEDDRAGIAADQREVVGLGFAGEGSAWE
jgi:hypothetical protein